MDKHFLADQLQRKLRATYETARRYDEDARVVVAKAKSNGSVSHSG